VESLEEGGPQKKKVKKDGESLNIVDICAR